MDGWLALLDALEERTARLAAVLDGNGDLPELPVIDLSTDVPLPQELRLRATSLLAETQRQERRMAERRAHLRRASAYARA